MENEYLTFVNEDGVKKTRAQIIIEKWKQSRAEEEERFQQKLKDPEYIAKLELLRDKMNKNDSSSST